MRLLIINPNTTEAMTAKAAAAAGAFFGPGVKIAAVSGRFGPRYIASRAAFAVAGHAALDAFATHGGAADKVLLACFGDPGLAAIREVSAAPVIGLVEASAQAALRHGERFAIVTGGVLWEPMLRESLAIARLDRGLAAIRTVAPDGGMIANDPDGAVALLTAACRACREEDGAESVILGGVGLLGLAERVAPGVGCPVICSVQAGFEAVRRAEAVTPGFARSAARPVPSIGLSGPLEALLGRPSD